MISSHSQRPVVRPIRTTAALAVAAGALLLSACGAGSGSGGGGSSDPGVTAETIKLGTTQPLTGPAAPGYARISKAMAAYFDYVNDQGGVHGRKIDLHIEDDGYNPTVTAEKTRELVLKEKVFALVGALGTPTHTSTLDFIRQNKIPDLFPASGSVSWNQPDKYPMTYGFQTDYVREGKILAHYVKENLPGKAVCTLGQGDDVGSSSLEGIQTVLGKDGLAASETYASSNPDVKAQIGKFQTAGCEVVISFSTPGFTALALSTAAKLGFEAQWLSSSVGADPAALAGYLKDQAAALTDGLIAGAWQPTAPDDSWLKLFTSINDEYNADTPMDQNVYYGYAIAYTFTQALQAAGEDLTREGLLEAVEKGGFQGPGLVPFGYSADDHSGYLGAAIVRMKDLAVEQITPAYVTDDGDGPVEEYDGERPQAPESGLPE